MKLAPTGHLAHRRPRSHDRQRRLGSGREALHTGGRTFDGARFASEREMAAKKKNSLVGNINRRKKAGTSRPKSKSTISKKSYAAMQAGWPKRGTKKKAGTKKSARSKKK
jgi:hypothetical protein